MIMKSVFKKAMFLFVAVVLAVTAESVQANTKETVVCRSSDPLWKINSLDKKDKNNDGMLSASESLKVKKLEIVNKNELKKLPYFPNLKTLQIDEIDNGYTLNLSKNKELTSLKCFQGLKKLNLRKNTKLNDLYLSKCSLTTLDLSCNPQLTELNLGNSTIKNLNLSNQGELRNLTLWDCIFHKKLDLSRCGKLETLVMERCSSKASSKLDLRKNKKLEKLVCTYSNLSELRLYQNNKIKTLNCSNNHLSRIDLQNNSVLKIFDCSKNRLKELDLRKCAKLETIVCAENKLTELDTSENTALTELICESNKLSQLNVENNPYLIILRIRNNKLGKLDVSANKKLSRLNCEYNRLTNLDLHNNRNLMVLRCIGNKLDKLDLSDNINLFRLLCDKVIEVTGFDSETYYSEKEYLSYYYMEDRLPQSY